MLKSTKNRVYNNALNFIINLNLEENGLLMKRIILTCLVLLFINTAIASAKTTVGPCLGRISSDYGYRIHPILGKRLFHKGIDIATKKGTKIYALQNGYVTFSGRNGNYGNVVEIDHYPEAPKIPRIKTKYAHNYKNLVKKGQYVRRGQVIALVGSTGRSTGSHVHFEVEYKKKSVNPKEYLKKLPKYLNYIKAYRNRYPNYKYAYNK